LIAGLLLVAEPGQAEIQVAAARRLPDKDVPILAAAIAARASALVSTAMAKVRGRRKQLMMQ